MRQLQTFNDLKIVSRRSVRLWKPLKERSFRIFCNNYLNGIEEKVQCFVNFNIDLSENKAESLIWALK